MLVFEFREAAANERYSEYSCRRIPTDQVEEEVHPEEVLGEITPLDPDYESEEQ